MSNKTNDYEHVNHPQHYNNYSKEVIDMMIDIYGIQNTITFCEMNAFKYRMRMGTKPDNDIQQDLNKEKWYLNKAHELKSILDKKDNTNNDNLTLDINELPDEMKLSLSTNTSKSNSIPYNTPNTDVTMKIINDDSIYYTN